MSLLLFLHSYHPCSIIFQRLTQQAQQVLRRDIGRVAPAQANNMRCAVCDTVSLVWPGKHFVSDKGQNLIYLDLRYNKVGILPLLDSGLHREGRELASCGSIGNLPGLP